MEVEAEVERAENEAKGANPTNVFVQSRQGTLRVDSAVWCGRCLCLAVRESGGVSYDGRVPVVCVRECEWKVGRLPLTAMEKVQLPERLEGTSVRALEKTRWGTESLDRGTARSNLAPGRAVGSAGDWTHRKGGVHPVNSEVPPEPP